jgi:hypothetical protein
VLFLTAFLGERTVCREAARVALVVGALEAGAALVAGARALFLLTSKEAFSLFSEDSSSLPRFLPRVEVEVGLATGLVIVALVVEDLLGAVFARAVRVLDVVVAAATGFFTAGPVLTGAGLGTGADGVRISRIGVARFVAGTRLTRRSRRSRMLAHWASHIARSLS